MKKSIYFIWMLVFCLGATTAFGQEEPAESEVRDGAYDKVLTKDKQIIPYDHLREADVFWSKRVWRVIDTREKMNKHFVYPEAPFIQIILDAAYNGEATVYSALDDKFTSPLTPDEVKGIGSSVDTIWVTDPETFEEKQEIVVNELNFENIKKFRLKEDWIFDEELSTRYVRILGISPIEDVIDENGNYRGPRPMFWIYYPDIRELLVKHESFNEFNDAVRMSWEDIFEMRYFASKIMKVSNVYDRRVQDYKTGVATLWEAEKLKDDLFKFEHDLWEY